MSVYWDILFCLSLKHKLSLLIEAQHDTLKFVNHDFGKGSFRELFVVILYENLCGEKDADEFPSLENLVLIIESNPELYCFFDVMVTGFYVLKRMGHERSLTKGLGTPHEFRELEERLNTLFKQRFDAAEIKGAHAKADDYVKEHSKSDSWTQDVVKAHKDSGSWKEISSGKSKRRT